MRVEPSPGRRHTSITIWRTLSKSGANCETVRRFGPEKRIKYQAPRNHE
jgi:hypothetical protein